MCCTQISSFSRDVAIDSPSVNKKLLNDDIPELVAPLGAGKLSEQPAK